MYVCKLEETPIFTNIFSRWILNRSQRIVLQDLVRHWNGRQFFFEENPFLVVEYAGKWFSLENDTCQFDISSFVLFFEGRKGKVVLTYESQTFRFEKKKFVKTKDTISLLEFLKTEKWKFWIFRETSKNKQIHQKVKCD